MTKFSPVTSDILQQLEEIVGSKGLSTLSQDLEKYSKDESLEPPHAPEVIVHPKTTSEISAIMKLASTYNISVTPQGSRTGLSGGAHPIYGGIVLSLNS